MGTSRYSKPGSRLLRREKLDVNLTATTEVGHMSASDPDDIADASRLHRASYELGVLHLPVLRTSDGGDHRVLVETLTDRELRDREGDSMRITRRQEVSCGPFAKIDA